MLSIGRHRRLELRAKHLAILLVHPAQVLEQVRQFLVINTGTLVDDTADNLVFIVADIHFDDTARITVLDGIAQQVDDGAFQHVGIRACPQFIMIEHML